MRKGVSLTDRGRVLPGPAPWFSLALPFSRPSTWPLVGGKKRRLPGVNRNPFSPPMRRGAQPPNPPPCFTTSPKPVYRIAACRRFAALVKPWAAPA